MKFIPRVLGYLRPYWRLAGFSAILIVVVSLVGLLVPWPLKILIDHALGSEKLPGWLGHLFRQDQKLALLLFAVIGGFSLTLIENALSVLDNYVHTKIEQRMILDFRSDLFRHALRLPLAFHDRQRAGGLIYAVNYQADAAAGLVMAIPPLVKSVITLVGMFWISLTIDPWLALLSLTVVPFLYWSVGYYATHIQPKLRAVRSLEGESLSIIHEAISMLRVIIAFGREKHEQARFRDQGERAIRARVRLTVRQTLFSLVVNMTTAIGTALVLGFGAWRALNGHVTIGQLLVVMSYIAAVYKPLEAISYTIGSLQDRFVSLQIAFDLLDTPPGIKDKPDAFELPRVRGAVRMENVQFSYEGRTDTLKDINLDVSPGQVIGIVGPTGAGKTTLVSLIPRFYAITSGKVMVDGHEISDVTLRTLRDQISLVSQEPLLFSGTVADNIRYGRLSATMDQIIDAAKSANAHDFIMRLPNQYETELGERGVQLSGGERQRLCVARAFIKDAPILILDEPTSAIDSKTEAVILDALDRLMVGRTTFMIAHRLSTLRRADKILVLDRGRIVEQGTHEELMARAGLYRQLHDMQSGVEKRAQRGRAENIESAAISGTPVQATVGEEVS